VVASGLYGWQKDDYDRGDDDYASKLLVERFWRRLEADDEQAKQLGPANGEASDFVRPLAAD
jgi:hypothetical protein